MSFNRILKLAEIVADSGDIELFRSLSTYIDSYIRKLSHMEPKNDGTTPNVWKKNMDYSPEENSPYFGSVSEFMKKFPGGIKDWVKWRNKTKKNRYKKYDIKERKACLEIIMKNAHFEPVGPDDTKNFPNEPHLYSGDGLEKFESIKEFIEKMRKNEQNAEDATKNAIKDMIEYWKTLQKDKK